MSLGKGPSSPPQQPNPNQLIRQQSLANTGAARLGTMLNRVNTIGPTGSSIYTNQGDTWTQTNQLSPQEQAIYKARGGVQAGLLGLGQQQLGRVAGALQNPVNYSRLPYAPNTYDFSADRNKVVADAYARQKSLLDPQWQQRQQDLSQNLADRGIGIGNTAYSQAQRDFSNQRDLSYAGARSDAMSQGDVEQQALYNMASQAHQQAVSEANMAHQQPLSDIAALLSGGGMPSMPQGYAPSPTQINPANTAAIQQQAYQNSLLPWQASQQQSADAWGSLAGLGGAALSGWGQAGFPGVSSALGAIGSWF